jgi:peptidoglycan/LPS O-acetylase OafA/YrhL
VTYRPLGAFRFGLSLLVVLQHSQHLLAPADRKLFDRTGFGMIAVAIFFVVSGFVVTEANAVFYAGRPWAFFINRIIRLAPPYFAALAVSMVVHALLWHANRLALWDFPGGAPPLTLPHVTAGVLGLVPGVITLRSRDAFEFIPFAWSLRMEMAFYAAALCAILAGLRLGGRSRPVIGLSLAAGLLASLWFLRLQRPGLLSCAPMFLAGVALCLALRRGGALRWGLVAAAVPAAALGFTSWGQHGHPLLMRQGVVLAMLLGLFVLLARGEAGRWLRLDKRLGDLSYPLYLNHYVVGIVLSDLFVTRGLGIYALAILLSVGLAALMGGIVDRPLVALRNRVRRRAI